MHLFQKYENALYWIARKEHQLAKTKGKRLKKEQKARLSAWEEKLVSMREEFQGYANATEYADEQGLPNIQYFVDADYSGANFNRLDWQRMLREEHIENPTAYWQRQGRNTPG